MKLNCYTIGNIEEALRKLDADATECQSRHDWRPLRFLKYLKETQPGERENIALAIPEPE